MATIDDYGAHDDTLAAPPLGGTDGWAAAVATALHSLEGSVTHYRRRFDSGMAGTMVPGYNDELWGAQGQVRCRIGAVRPGDIIDMTFTVYIPAQPGAIQLYPFLGSGATFVQQMFEDSQFSTWYCETGPARVDTFRAVATCNFQSGDAYTSVRGMNTWATTQAISTAGLPMMTDVIVHRKWLP